MKVSNMKTPHGNTAPNQFIIEDGGCRFFQSYETIIVKIDGDKIFLDNSAWDYSATTARYRNVFLDMTTKEIRTKIKSGEIGLINLN